MNCKKIAKNDCDNDITKTKLHMLFIKGISNKALGKDGLNKELRRFEMN